MSGGGKSIVKRTWIANQAIGLLALLLLMASDGRAFSQSRPLESLSAEELKVRAKENAEALADDSLRLGERIDRLSQQTLIHRRLMQHREALRAGLVYHEVIRRNGRNTDLLKSALSISEDLLALNEAAKAEKLLTETLAGIGDGPLDPITELAARAKLAGLAQRSGREALAAERWLAVETSAEKALRLIDQRVLPGKDRAFCVTSLATSIAARGETQPAVETGDGVRKQANRRVVVTVQ